MSDAPRRPTVADVAREAGTSTAVVSYVVNNGPRHVTDATRARVERAIATLNYRRNSLAGALSVGRSNLVGLLVPDSSNAFFSELARHIESEARSHGYLTVLGNTNYDRVVERGYETAFADLQAAGVFVVTIDPQPPIDDHTPRVYLHSTPAGGSPSSVICDDEAGARLAVEHLVSHGHTEIHCITGPHDFGPSGHRMAGWVSAMRDAGLPTADLLHRVSMDRIEAEIALREMLAEAMPPAFFATTDEHALALMRAASQAGVRIPEDAAIIGFDGIREALLGSVRLTTVALPLAEMARKAFEHLDGWSKGAEQFPTVLAPALVIGETCGNHDTTDP